VAEAVCGSSSTKTADLRRAQVIAAATTCFTREGFHAASMASIAAEATMSVGQIYRYFENKEAVIEALVAEKLENLASRLAQANARSPDPLEQLLEVARHRADDIDQSKRAALLLEFLAEAARNPRIAAMLRMIDEAVRAYLKAILLRAGFDEGPALSAKLNIIVMALDGWPLCVVKDPELSVDGYLELVRPVFAAVLDRAPSA